MDPLTDLVGLSPAISAVREDVRRVLATQPLARRPAPLLLQGETGTGKGLLARACHQASHRAGPFVSINCAAIPESLMEAELFGYARGAFTGAVTAKAGLFQSARGGTIFLDEIGLIGDALQTKLLSVVDERTVRRLGSTLTEPVDVWIMAATSLDLEESARTGGFRQDLYHRLAVLPIRLPPLRERGGDILLLAEEFLARACRDYGLPFKRLTADARTALLEYQWPGNVRELANVMERATLLCAQDEIDAAALALRRPPSGNPSAAASRETVRATAVENVHVATPDYRASLDQVERVRLREALTRTGWNVARAAEQLGIPRNSLRYRLARLELGPDEPRRRRGGAPAPVAAPPELRSDPRREPGAPPRQRAVSFLRVGAAGSRAAETRWISSEGLDLIAEKIGTFGGRIIRRDTMHIEAAFGLDPAEDAPGRAGNAALAIRTLVARARAEYPDVRVVSALETVTCLVEERQGESHIDERSLHDIERALSALTSDAAADGIVVGPGAAPHLERQFALAPGSVGPDEHELTSLVGRERAPRAVPGPRRSPFAGRSQEVSFLRERLRQVAETGRGHIVGLMGEPGIGKSRLLAEFTATLTRERIALVEGRCASHATTTPYALLLDILRRTWHLDDLDTPDALAAEISRRVSTLEGKDENTPVVLSLLGLRTAPLDISPEGVKARAFAVLNSLLLAQTRSGPLVLMVEDLHWADQTSQEFLAALADSLPGSPTLIVATMRPGYRAPWLDRSWASQLALPPLSLDHSLAIVHALRPELPDRSAETMARRAEGNPFFLEELTRAVGDRVIADSAVPGTITDVIRARMDRLPVESRRVLETATVLGREVPLSLLAIVTETPGAALASSMRELVATEFLFEQPPLTFVFKHALTHDVAYGCLAEADRGRLHAAAARALERLHADRTDVVLDELANHWSQTGDHRRAIHYLRRLGARAVASSAPSEALAALEPALHKAEQLPEGAERERTVLSIVTEFTMPFVLLGRIDEVKKLLLGYQPRVERLDDLALVGRFFASIALPHDHIGEYREAEAFAGRALEAATRVGDEATMSMALTVLTLASLWGGRFTEGIERADRAVPLGGPDVAMWRGLSLWVKAHEEILLGRLEGGVRCSEALWQVGTASENRHLQSYARCAAGWIANLKGDSQTALELCEKAVELAASPFTRAVVVAYLGEALDAAGRHGDAREQLVSSVEFCRRFNFPQLVAWNLARLSVAELGTGDRRHARVLAEDALSVARAVEFPYAEALALRACGLVAHAERAFASAVEHLAAALATLVQIDCRYHAAIVRLDLATALAETGARDEARQHLDRSAGEFRALAIPVWETRTATLARRLGLAPANESADDA